MPTTATKSIVVDVGVDLLIVLCCFIIIIYLMYSMLLTLTLCYMLEDCCNMLEM